MSYTIVFILFQGPMSIILRLSKFFPQLGYNSCVHERYMVQESFWVRAQPMKNNVALKRRLSLAELIPRMIPVGQ